MEFDFSKNTTVSTLDKVPEDFRGLYTQTEGEETFSIDATDPKVKSSVAAIIRMNEALKASRGEAKNLKGKQIDLSPLADYGDNPASIAETVAAKIEEFTQELAKGGDAKLNLDKMKDDLSRGHTVELEKKDLRNTALQNQLYKLLVENVASTAITDQKGSAKLLMPFVKDQVKVVEEDGEFRVFIVDKAGDRRFSGATGAEMTINELVTDMKGQEDYAPLFDSETPAGGGVKPGTATRRPASQNAERTANEKIADGLRKGQANRT